MHGGFDGCYSSVLVLHGKDEDEEYNIDTTPRPPPLSTCSWSLLVHWCWL